MPPYYIDSPSKVPFDIEFTFAPSACIQGGINVETPFVVSISAPDQGEHVIELYSRNSNSIYPTDVNKWSHLAPIWTFEDSEKNPIKTVTTTDTNIYTLNGQFILETDELFTSACEFAGTSGYAEFYYRDSYPSTGSVYIIATLNTFGLPMSSESYNGEVQLPSYANSQIGTITPIRIDALKPNGLGVTRDGLNNLSDSTYWVNQLIPMVITVTGTNSDYNLSDYDCNGIILNAPIRNDAGLSEPIQVSASISTLPSAYQIWNSDGDGSFPPIIEIDEKGFNVGGYSVTNVISLCEGNSNIIQADAVVKSLSSEFDSTFMWISNPEAGYLHRVSTPIGDTSLVSVATAYCEDFPNVVFTGRLSSTNVLPTVTARPDSMSLSGFGGVYSIVTDTRVGSRSIFVSDVETNYIHKMTFEGGLSASLSCGDMTPCGLSLSVSGLYATFFEYPEIWKINSDTLTLESSASFATSGIDMLSTASTSGNYSYKPVLIDTDSALNVWTTFSNPNANVGHLYKLSEDLTSTLSEIPLTGISTPSYNDSTPFDLKCSSDYVFVTLPKYSKFSEDTIYPYGGIAMVNSNTGEASYIVNNSVLKNPSYITIKETLGNILVAVSCDVNKVLIFNASLLPSPVSTNPDIHVITVYTVVTCGEANPNNGYDSFTGSETIGGLSFDLEGRIAVINTYENKIYYIKSSNNIFSIDPDLTMDFNTVENGQYASNTSRYVDSYGNQVDIEGSVPVPSIRAQGDWSGWQFTMKTDGYEYPISGVSSVFKIENYDNYQYRKFNEDFDVAETIQENLLIPSLKDNTVLIDDYIGKSLGGNDDRYSMARYVVEKIANLPRNLADVDVCNIDAIYSHANMMEINIDDYRFGYPSEILRIIDTFSQNYSNIVGSRCGCTQNYLRNASEGYCETCGHTHTSNLGSILTNSYQISADTPYLAEYRYERGNFHKFIPTTEYITTSGRDLLTHAMTLLPENVIISDYVFHEFIPTECGYLNIGSINWDDEKSTLTDMLSGGSYEEIFGTNQTLEKMFNYLLHQGLGFETLSS